MLLEQEFRRRDVSFDVVLELDATDVIKKYVEAGLGISVIPEIAMEPDDEDRLGVFGLADLLPLQDAWMFTLKYKYVNTPIENFISIAEEVLSSRQRWKARLGTE